MGNYTKRNIEVNDKLFQKGSPRQIIHMEHGFQRATKQEIW